MDQYDEPGGWRGWLVPPADEAVRTYLSEIGHIRRLPEADQARLREQAAGGDRDATQRLAEAYLQLVVFVARDYIDRGLGLIEILQAGNIGLLRALHDLGDLPSGMPLRDVAEREIRASMDRIVSG